MEIRRVTLHKLTDDFLFTFQRYQETHKVLVEIDNRLIEKNDSFIDDWDTAKKVAIVEELRACLTAGGIVLGAYENQALLGFANIEPTRFGHQREYIELSYLHVSREFRGRGIGKKLFEVCNEMGNKLGAQKLYIAAHPSIESQLFYKKMGCTLASYIEKDILSKEPLDIQLERKITPSF